MSRRPDRHGVVAFLHNDVSGLCRGRAFPLGDLERRRRTGVGWVPANQALTPFGPIADPNPWGSIGDLRLVPDPETEVRVDLWPDTSPVHFFLCDAAQVDGSEWDACPRTLLRNALSQLEREAGVRLLASFEQEFRLSLPSDDDRVAAPFSFEALRQAEPFAPLLLAALEQAGIDVENVLPEYGQRQWELTYAPQAGVRAADQAAIVRELVREVARRLGGRASFTPMVHPGEPGNGLHIHFSFRDEDGRPLGYDPERPAGVGELAGRFMAGVLEHLPALCAFTAPSAVSYVRLTPNRWSAGFSFVGRQNREAALRVPAAPSPADFNLEFRAADCASCPHLALAMLVLAGLDGIRRALQPAAVWDRDPQDLSEEERAAHGMNRLPDSLESALAAAESDAYLRACLSPNLFDAYLSLKRTELSMLEDCSLEERCARYSDAY